MPYRISNGANSKQELKSRKSGGNVGTRFDLVLILNEWRCRLLGSYSGLSLLLVLGMKILQMLDIRNKGESLSRSGGSSSSSENYGRW